MPQLIRGQYELLEKLGTGGMGEVFKARDTKLNRFVAVKILKSEQSVDPDQRRRFLQEAQAASALNHPHIIVIHDVISDEGVDYMIMELVDGKTLAHLIPPHGMPVAEVVNLGMQIAEGLSAAHQAGIMHRDLKPGNLMVTNTGRVKILDFGLAKFETAPTSSDPDATLLQTMTMQGSIIGTLCYMSPEQAQAKKVDARTDIFSFGAVLFEMATGQRAFQGDNPISTLTSVLRDQPPSLQQVNAGAPPQLQSLIESCLKKEPDERTQTMREVFEWLTLLKKLSDSGTLHSMILKAPPTQAIPASVVAAATSAPVSAITALPDAPKKKRKGIWVALAAVLVGIFLFRGREPKAVIVVRPLEATKPKGLTNNKIIEMVKSDVSTPLIISQIRSTGGDFDLSADGVIKLVQAEVPDAVIEAMRNPKGSPFAVPPNDEPARKENSAKPVRTIRLADATPLALELAEDIPLIATEGQSLTFTSVVDVKVGDTIVIAKGAKAMGAIYSKGKKKLIIVGRGTKVTFELLSVEASGGGRVKLRATPMAKDDESRPFESKSKLMIATKGMSFIGYVAGNQEIAVAAKK